MYDLRSLSRIRSYWLLVLSLSVLPGCGEATPEPSDPLLLGEWGSESALFIALRSGAEVQFPCAAVVIDEPIELQAGLTFMVHGRLQSSSAVLGDLPKIRGTGELTGSRVVLALALPPAGDVTTFDLQAGVRPNSPELPTCPQ